jgi:DNA invertase Pin-like site-specific DNA recombinase
MFHIIAALVEFERDIISERAITRLEAACARGRKGEGAMRLSGFPYTSSSGQKSYMPPARIQSSRS